MRWDFYSDSVFASGCQNLRVSKICYLLKFGFKKNSCTLLTAYRPHSATCSVIWLICCLMDWDFLLFCQWVHKYKPLQEIPEFSFFLNTQWEKTCTVQNSLLETSFCLQRVCGISKRKFYLDFLSTG